MSAGTDSAGPIAADVLEEGERLAAEAERRDVPMRLLGGVAIQLRGRGRIPDALVRSPQDIDVIVAKGAQPEVTALLTAAGYGEDEAFNLVEGSRRLLFHDEEHGRHLDVFVDEFEMCHDLPLSERLLLEQTTVPIAELALTKLQIVELNEKDRNDLYALLHAHPVGDCDGTTLNATVIAGLCAGDWGLWRTCTLNLERLRNGLAATRLTADERRAVDRGLVALEQAIEAEPKGRKWRLRARVGERVKWFKTPDEIHDP
jgi:hypothetical protein